ncbi:SPRY domain-containing protein 7-like [Actinia tenebrosa]|uniref:SPRY domain-containing protein 7 n=1 Tax=Actinia tenebrosa TaxID=6105 RepID=A0A6P8HEC7_ACTTE|nr:SPRY domain-containing protein 7-like [Actinia tenebrosa]
MDVCGLGILCCLRRYQKPRNDKDVNEIQVQLDTTQMGHEVVIVKSGRRICGSGAALANAPLLQNKCYFEAKIQSGGVWGIGIATKKCDLNKIPLGNSPDSWVLRSDGTVAHNSIIHHKLTTIPEEGDIIACTFDHVEANFYHNGKHLHSPLTGFRETVYPIIYVDDGTIVDVNFKDFVFEPPSGFTGIMFEKSLL